MSRVVILLGPTGVGKTSASILLAQHLGAEIINADSMQIYRHMDIGTAKPSPQQRSAVKHHMIDIADPWEAFSTGKYISMAAPVFESLQAGGNPPVVAGGTGLYIRAMTRGLFSGPTADWDLRQKLRSMEAQEEGSLFRLLEETDPEASAKITPRDTRRIIRALEVCMKSDSRMSELQKQLTRPLPYVFLKIGLSRDRRELYRMIEERVDEMIRSGLVDEVRKLMTLIREKRGAQDPPFASLQAIGYKEIVQHLTGEISLDEAVRLIKRDSKRYAKRQFTWFRKEDDVHWVDITGIRDSGEIFKRIIPYLDTTLAA
jgi:tRNA dimethylallyltransferase